LNNISVLDLELFAFFAVQVDINQRPLTCLIDALNA
jgi:hypothetical protein